MLKGRFLAFLLTLIILLSSFFGCSDSLDTPKSTQKRPAATSKQTDAPAPDEEEPPENKAVVGTLLSLSGNFRLPPSSASSADGEIYSLTNGYSTLAMTSGGSYVWDSTVVKSHTEEEIDGNVVITIELCEDLLFSDGTPVKAKNYLAYLLAFSSPIASSAGLLSDAGASFVGYEEFAVYNGTNEGKTAIFTDNNGNEKRVAASKTFGGIRLLGDLSFSLTLKSKEYSPYYAYICANLTPYVIEHILGTDVTVKDSSKGVYLDGPWYERKSGVYIKAAHLDNARRELSAYAFSGPYVISEWDAGNGECTLSINPNYKGNYEGVKPSIETLVYTKLVPETQLDALTLGVVDVISGISGSSGADASLAAVRNSGGSLAATYYLESGYKKLSLNCDLGPTAFLSVRKALAYALDSEGIANELTGGYGAALYAPYSDELDAWKQQGGNIELIKYAHSLKKAKEALISDGWIYNSDGSEYNEETGGVRYKKLTPEEAEAHLAYALTIGEIEYKTELVGEDYYLPCAISWLGIDKDGFTLIVSQRLSEDGIADALGVVISLSLSDGKSQDGSAYCMRTAEEYWSSAIYEPSADLKDPYDLILPYGEGGISLGEALELSGGRLGLDYLSRAMLLDSNSQEEFYQWWGEYLERWNALVPDVVLCASYRFDLYNTKIKGFDTSPFRTVADALVYCSVE